MQTILVVEDDEDVLKLIKMVLQNAGYEVLVALSGEQALEMTDANDCPIHLLLADVILTGMRGHQLAEHLYVSHPAMRVIFITGYVVEKIEAEIADVPKDLLITKPISMGDLLNKVKIVLRDSTSAGTVSRS